MDYAAIHIPEFPIVAWLRANPAARPHALALIEGTAPLQRVVSINRAARSQGVLRGMSKVQAEATGAVLFRLRCVVEETANFKCVAEIADCYSPRIQVLALSREFHRKRLVLTVHLCVGA